jgi:hypothetical protein
MNMIENWQCTQDGRLREPLLLIRTTEGRELAFMLPAIAAEQLGLALLAQARQTAPTGPSH